MFEIDGKKPKDWLELTELENKSIYELPECDLQMIHKCLTTINARVKMNIDANNILTVDYVSVVEATSAMDELYKKAE